MGKKILFINRDGAIMQEQGASRTNYASKLCFVPRVLSSLRKITEMGEYHLVMLSDRDELETEVFMVGTSYTLNQVMLEILAGEGVVFDKILNNKSKLTQNILDKNLNNSSRFTEYLDGDYDIKNSFVIGNKLTDILLAKKMGCQAILIPNDSTELNNNELIKTCVLCSTDWDEIYSKIALSARCVSLNRNTNETKISIVLNLDGTGKSEIDTGLKFFDHMLDQLVRHSESDIKLSCNGDLEVDEHHTIEDVAIVLGNAFNQAVGNKEGMERYGFFLPMDDCNAQVAIDFGGRSWINWNVDFKREYIGDMPTEMIYHFFKTFSDACHCNLYVKAEGINEHHKLEAIFKALAKSIKIAKNRNPDRMILPSTKGQL
ncbi:MAG: imidazoleglycerol-phosphate dehydratase HisB [Bacteroidales bacterium]